MPRFEINEIAVYHSDEGSIEPNGIELTILGLPFERGDGLEYMVSGFVHGHNAVYERNLRKRNPPMGDWESLESNIGWKRPVETVT